MSGQRHPDEHVSRARTVDEAVAEALLYLGARRDEVDVEVLEEGSGGLFGLIGRRPAVVRVTRRRGRPAGRADNRTGEAAGSPSEGGRPRRRRRRRPAAERGRREEERRPPEKAATENAGNQEKAAPAAPSTAPSTDAPAGSEAPEGRRRRRPRRRRRRPAGDEGAAAATEAAAVQERRPTPREQEKGTEMREETKPQDRPAPAAAAVSHRASELVEPLAPVPVADAAELQRSLAAELMRRGGFLSRCTVIAGEYNQVRIVTDGDSAAVLIGHHGHTIDAVEHLVDRLSARILGEHVPVNVDINNYRRRREGQLVSLARRAVSQVRATGEEVHLPPQNARDRRVVHLEVAEMEGVTTYSDGEGLERHVVVTLEGRVPDWYQPPAHAATGQPSGEPSGEAGDARPEAGDPGA